MTYQSSVTAKADPRIGLGVILGVCASLAFATSGPFGRTLFDIGWTPGAAVFWRTLGGGVLLLPLGLWALRGRWVELAREWRLIAAFGALGVATAQALFFAAVSRMSVSIALLIEYTAPVMLVLWAWTRTRRAPSALVVGGSAVSLLGLLFVLDLTGARPDPLGILFALASMVGAAGYFVLSARPSALPPVTLASAGLLAGSAALGLLLLTGFIPYAAPLEDVVIVGVAAPWWVSLVVIIVVSTALAYGLGITGVSLMGERLGSFVSLSEVVFASVLAGFLLGQVPSPVQLVGGALILVGVVLIKAARTESAQDAANRQRAVGGQPATALLTVGSSAEETSPEMTG